MKIKSCLILTGIGDYSLTNNFYKKNIIDQYSALIASVLKEKGINVCFIDVRDNYFNKTLLYSTIETLKPDSCIIRGELFNLNNIYNLHLDNYIPKIFILSENSSITLSANYNLLLWDNTQNHEINLFNILEKMLLGIALEDIKALIDTYEHWCFIDKTAHPYTVSIDSGFGCNRLCSFCNIKNSLYSSRNSRDLVNEVEYLIGQLKQEKFLIGTHCWASDLDQFCMFFEHLVNTNLVNNKFTWACTILPEYLPEIVNNEQLISNIEKSNLGQIFVPLEHVNDRILGDLNISYNKSELIHSLKKLESIGIPSIVINYIIGSKHESIDTINELINYSSEILNNVSCVEFNVSYYSNDILQKTRRAQDTEFITRQQMMTLKQYIQSQFVSFMQQNISKMSFLNQLKQIEINLFGLNTQIFTYYLTRTPLVSIYNNTKNHKLLNFSFEITDNILEYRPVFHSVIEYNKDNKPYIQINPFLSKEGQAIRLLNKLEFQFVEQTKRYSTLNTIIKRIAEQEYLSCEKIKQDILDFYSQLECLGLLNYTRMLKV
jgi:tRNA A37 methylthiotransferase MiaB